MIVQNSVKWWGEGNTSPLLHETYWRKLQSQPSLEKELCKGSMHSEYSRIQWPQQAMPHPPQWLFLGIVRIRKMSTSLYLIVLLFILTSFSSLIPSDGSDGLGVINHIPQTQATSPDLKNQRAKLFAFDIHNVD